jgi:exopolyphosphatase/pppGpp-phosphohydrolase
MTVPATATARDGNNPNDFFSRLRRVIAHILDVDESKLLIPPG